VFLLAALCLGTGVYAQDVNPNENSWLPFFGLAFSVFLWINVIFFGIAILKKHLFLIIPLVSLVYAWPSIKNYYKLFPKTEFSQENIEELKMMTYNVRIFDANKNLGGNMKDSIFSLLEKQDINLICFQEFYYAESPGEFDTKSIVQNEIGLKNTFENYTHHMRGGLHAGVATFTSYPIVNKGKIEFSSDANNTCIYTDIKIGTDTLRVYNAHLASIRFQYEDYSFLHEQETELDISGDKINGYKRVISLMAKAYEKRAVQLQKVLDHIYECPFPVVLAGDFNDTPVSYCYNQTRKYLTDSFIESGSGVGKTYIGEFPSYRIDYVFHSEEIESAAYQTLDYHFSDHRPVYCKLRVKP